jgi:ribonucleoside-diphosphate reductase alpha chain
MERIATEGTLAHLEEVPDDVKRVFVCAHDIAPEWHIRMQAAFQRHCDASISKTINFPEHAGVDDVAKIYRLAYELDCKGVTVYRDGCRNEQPMALRSSGQQRGGEDAEGESPGAAQAPLEPAILPEICAGIRVRQLTPFGNMHINITVDPNTERELEVFAQLGKGGDLANSDLEAICRLISLWLRSGGSLRHVVRQLHSIGSSLQLHTKEGKIMSLGDGLARGLKRYMQSKAERGLRALLVGEAALEKPGTQAGANGRKANGKGGNGAGRATIKNAEIPSRRVAAGSDALGFQWQQTQYKVVCPDCQRPLRFSEGCVTCDACGFSKC